MGRQRRSSTRKSQCPARQNPAHARRLPRRMGRSDVEHAPRWTVCSPRWLSRLTAPTFEHTPPWGIHSHASWSACLLSICTDFHLNRPLRIGLTQVFSAKRALALLAAIPRADCPDLILFPEGCFQIQDFCDLLEASHYIQPSAGLIASMVMQKQKSPADPDKENGVMICVRGTGKPIYKRISPTSARCSGDRSEVNLNAFRTQRKRCFIAVSTDLPQLAALPVSPEILLVLAAGNGAPPTMPPTPGFTGHLFYANGQRDSSCTSFYCHVGVNGGGAISIPPGVEDLRVITVPYTAHPSA